MRLRPRLNLHEDYDALGLYITSCSASNLLGEILLEAATENIPPDPRKRTEGRSSRAGIVRRSITPDLMPEWPEAFVLYRPNLYHRDPVGIPSR